MSDLISIGHNAPQPEIPAVEVWTGRLGHLERQLQAIPLPLNDLKAAEMRDVLAEATSILKNSDAERREIQAPHETRLTAIRNLFRSVTAKGEEIRDLARKNLDQFMAAKELELKRQAEQEKAKADAAAKAAQEALAASRGDLDQWAPGDDAAKTAAEAAISAEHAVKMAEAGVAIQSASGSAKAASYRTSWYVAVTDSRKLVKAFQDHPEMIELATRLAAAQVRAAKGNLRKPIPGCEPVERRTVV